MIDGDLAKWRTTRVLDRWFSHAYSPAVQIIVAASSAIAASIFLWATRVEIQTVTPVVWQSYIAVGWTAAIGSNALYWMIVSPHVVVALVKGRCIQLNWISPGATPAARALVRGILVAGTWLASGSVAVMLLLFYGPQVSKLVTLRWILIGIVILVAIIMAVSVVYPIMIISNACNARKERSIATLMRNGPRLGGAVQGTMPDAAMNRAQLLAQVASTNSIPFGTASVVQYGAVILAGIAAPIFAVFARIIEEAIK